VYSDISDHFPVAMHFDLKLDKIRTMSSCAKRVYSPESIETFKLALNSIDWSDVCMEAMHCSNASVPYEIFINKFTASFDDHLQLKLKKQRT